MGKENTEEDVDYVLGILPGIVDRLRQMSPLYRQTQRIADRGAESGRKGTTVTRVVVALSGGVDSAVAAALLVEQGYDVVGVMMRLWTAGERPLENRCCSAEAVDDARRVADLLDIPFYLVNYERQFQQHVVDYFLDEYARGRTPNPCLACNRFIKFDMLLKRALALDAEYLATGHYCRIVQGRQGSGCCAAWIVKKDQSYMLHILGQEQLAHMLFPLGELTKDQVRSRGRRARAARGREGREPGPLLRAGGRLSRRCCARAGHSPWCRVPWRTTAATRSACIRVCRSTRWVSGTGWA